MGRVSERVHSRGEAEEDGAGPPSCTPSALMEAPIVVAGGQDGVAARRSRSG